MGLMEEAAEARAMTVEGFQTRIEEIFGVRDRSATLNDGLAWLAEEVGELAQAIRRGHSPQLHAEEIADVMARVVSLASCLGIDVAGALHERYKRGCPKCCCIPCACPPVLETKAPCGSESEEVQRFIGAFRKARWVYVPLVPDQEGHLMERRPWHDDGPHERIRILWDGKKHLVLYSVAEPNPEGPGILFRHLQNYSLDEFAHLRGISLEA